MNVRNRLMGLVLGILFSTGANALDLNSSYAPLSARSDASQRNTVQWDKEKEEYLFSYQEDGFGLVYGINNHDTNVLKGMISVRVVIDDKDRLVPIFQGGLIVRDQAGGVWMPADSKEGRTVKLISHESTESGVLYHFEEKIQDQVLNKWFRFSIRGKTLIMEAAGDITNSTSAYYAGFDLGKSRLTTFPVVYRFPSVNLPVVHVDNKYFLSTYVDPLISTTGRYEMTEDIIRARSMQASNTPAWLMEDAKGKRPSLEVTSYLTVSNHVLDVLPTSRDFTNTSADSLHNQALLRGKTVIDLHQLPFTQRPFQTVETIRRWEAPEAGRVDFKGTFQLYQGESANCTVYLREANTDKERNLFSQVLNLTDKKSAGMQGAFPIQKGDQLLFSVSGPAVMDGGSVLLDVRMDHEGETYSSYDDYSDQQGDHGWYYEQRIGEQRTLMIWNPQQGQWESPFTRSFQNAGTLVCRSGSAGDAFETAERFFDELRWMGLADLCFLVRDWSDRARFAPPPDMDHNELVWGSGSRLLELTQREQERGNLIVPVVGAKRLGLPDFNKGLSGLSLTQIPSLLSENLPAKAIDALREYVGTMDQKMHRQGLWLEAPSGLDRIKMESLYYQLLGIAESSSAAAGRSIQEQISSIRGFVGSPLVLDWSDAKTRFDFFARPLFDGIASPLLTDSNALNLVDEEIAQGRKSLRIGFGSYEGFYQGSSDKRAIDLRMFPLDQYMTSMLAFARVPLISGGVWSPGFDGRKVRRYLLEMIALLQPVSREYLDPKNERYHVLYQSSEKPGFDLSVEEVFHQNQTEKVTRVKIEYENGLHIFANRSSEPWAVESPGISPVLIAEDGYLAHNAQTDLISLIGKYGDQTFSMSRTPKSFFLDSRGGGLIRFENYSTDGMLHRWQNPYSIHPNMACLSLTEASQSDPNRPLLRSNRRVDCCVEWKSDRQVELHLLEVDQEPVLLEYFDAPQEWFDEEGKNLTITRYRDGEEIPKEAPQWYLTTSASIRGIRFIDVHMGDRFVITYSK